MIDRPVCLQCGTKLRVDEAWKAQHPDGIPHHCSTECREAGQVRSTLGTRECGNCEGRGVLEVDSDTLFGHVCSYCQGTGRR